MIAKITSFIILIIILGYLFLTSIQQKKFIMFKNILLMILIVFSINLPRLIYRKQNISLAFYRAGCYFYNRFFV